MRTSKKSNISSQLLVGLGILADDERYMKRALKSVNRLVAEKQKEEYSVDSCCLTIEELEAVVEEGRAEIEHGGGIPSKDVYAEMEKKYPFLCK